MENVKLLAAAAACSPPPPDDDARRGRLRTLRADVGFQRSISASLRRRSRIGRVTACQTWNWVTLRDPATQ